MDKKLISNSLIYSVLTFLQPLSSFILLPLYLNRLQPEEYAVFVLMTNFSAFISLVSAIGIGSSVINFYFNYHKNPIALKKYISGIINFSIICNILFFIIVLVVGPFCFQYFFNSSKISFYPYGILSVAIGCLSTISAPYLIFLKNSQKIVGYSILTLISIILTVFFQIQFLINLNLGIYGLLWAKIIGLSIPVIVILLLEFKTLLNGINFKIVKPSFQFALNYLPTTILSWAYSYIDRFIIENTLDLNKLGVYSLLLTFTSMIEMFYLAIGSAVQPILYNLYSEQVQTSKINFEKMNQVLKFYFHIILIALSLLILLITNIELFLSNTHYIEIKKYVTISSIGFFIGSYIYIFVLNIFYHKKTKVLLVVQLLSVVVIILLDFLLIPHFGLFGALYVSLFSKLVLFLFSYYASQKTFKINYNFNDLFLIPFLIVSFMILGNLFAAYNYISWNIFGIVQFLIVFLLLLSLNSRILLKGKKLLLSVFIP